MQKMASYDHRKIMVGQTYPRHKSEVQETPYDIHLKSAETFRLPNDRLAFCIRTYRDCVPRTGFVRYPLKICGDLRLRYDRLAFLYQNVDKRQIKKSYYARMNYKHIRRSPRSPTMSKNRRENRRPINRMMIGANVT